MISEMCYLLSHQLFKASLGKSNTSKWPGMSTFLLPQGLKKDWKEFCLQKANQMSCYYLLNTGLFCIAYNWYISFNTFSHKMTCSSYCTVYPLPRNLYVLQFTSDHPWFRVCRSGACLKFCPAAVATQLGALKQVCPMFLFFLAEEPDSLKNLC